MSSPKKHRWKPWIRAGFALCLDLPACSNTTANPRGRVPTPTDATHPQWLIDLVDERHGAATFRRLADGSPLDEKLNSRASMFRYADAVLLESPRGPSVAVGLDRPAFGCCARGLRYYFGGIESPDFGPEEHDAVLLVARSGVPDRAAWTGRFGPNLVLTDANGDGRVEEVIHYSNGFYFDEIEPFVTIFSVREGKVRLLFSLVFNGGIEVPPGPYESLEVPIEVKTSAGVSEPAPTAKDNDPVRHGGWSLVPSENGYNDLAVYETIDGASRLVAQFPYSPERGHWLYPQELPGDAIWSRPDTYRNVFGPVGRGRSFESATSLAIAGNGPDAGIRASTQRPALWVW